MDKKVGNKRVQYREAWKEASKYAFKNLSKKREIRGAAELKAKACAACAYLKQDKCTKYDKKDDCIYLRKVAVGIIKI